MDPLPASHLLEKLVAEVKETLNHESRLTVVETTLRTIVGDNSGGSGLLHNIDKKVDTLAEEFAGIKKVLIFLGIMIPIVLGVLALIYKH